MPIRASQARPAYAPPRSAPARPLDWALDLGLGLRPAPLASISVHRLRHHSPSPAAQSHLDASSSANLVDRPLSTPAATRGPVDALCRGPRRYQTRSRQGGRALLQRESRCVLVLPASSSWPPSSASSRPRQLLEPLRGRDDELTRAPRAQGGSAGRVERRVERRRCWRSTSSGSSRSLYVPPAHSSRATNSGMDLCTRTSCALTSFTLRAGQSSPRWHPSSVRVSKARLFACRPPLDGAGRCSLCLSRKDSGPGCRKMSVSSSLLVPAAERVEPSWTGPTEAAPALSCP